MQKSRIVKSVYKVNIPCAMTDKGTVSELFQFGLDHLCTGKKKKKSQFLWLSPRYKHWLVLNCQEIEIMHMIKN